LVTRSTTQAIRDPLAKATNSKSRTRSREFQMVHSADEDEQTRLQDRQHEQQENAFGGRRAVIEANRAPARFDRAANRTASFRTCWRAPLRRIGGEPSRPP
jgi:hypothetical protein